MIKQFKIPLFTLNSTIKNELKITNSDILLAYHLNGAFGKTFEDFCELYKNNKYLINFITKNNFYVYCTTEEDKSYFETVKTWGVNIKDICVGDELFFDKVVYKTKTIRVNKKFVRVPINYKFIIKDEYKEFFEQMRIKKTFMNPPYDGNKHLQILEGVLSISDKTVNISPIRWLQDPLEPVKKNSDYNTFRNIIPQIESLDVFSMERMAEIFDGIDVPGGIYYLTKKGGFDITTIQSPFLTCLSSLKYDKIIDHLETDKIDGWRVRCGGNGGGFKSSTRPNSDSVKLSKINYIHYKLNRIYLNGYTPDGKFWSEDRMPGAGNKMKPIGTPIPSSVHFESQEKAEEFVKFTKLKFIQYLCLEAKTYSAELDKFMPWFDDFNKTNEDLCKFFFGELDTEGNYLPNPGGYIDDNNAIAGTFWETILKTMKEYE